jgi:hypothetical protein
MNALCLAVAGAIQAVLPISSFTLAWTHSVEKVRWEEDYRIRDERLQLTEARVQGSGAGMEPPAGATFQGGWWSYHPRSAPLESLSLARSSYTEDYTLCWDNQCRSLTDLIGEPPERGETELFPCMAAQEP